MSFTQFITRMTNYSTFQTSPHTLSPVIRLLAILIQNNSNGTSATGERSSDAKAQSTTQIDDFEPKVLVALYETLYTFIVNILQVSWSYFGHSVLIAGEYYLNPNINPITSIC